MKNILLSLLLVSLLSCSQKKANIQIGNHFGRIQNGLVVIYNDTLATNLRFGWMAGANYYNQYNDLIREQYYKGDHEPDARYANSYWLSQNRRIDLEYSKIDEEVIVKISSDEDVEFMVEAIPSWPGYSMLYSFKNNKLISLDSANRKLEYETIFTRSPEKLYQADDADNLTKAIVEDESASGDWRSAIAMLFTITPEKPLYFTINSRLSESEMDERLALEKQKYQQTKLQSSGDWGDFASPIISNLQHSRAYNFKHKTTSTVVSHHWTMWGGQRLFEWDTFFNGLLLSLEDPEAAKEDFRGILAYQQPNGMVPNVACPVSEISVDRSQPPVGSLCVWKYFLHTADTAFLQEVYPQLLRWNRWWFSINEATGLPYRDGNQNGLLEWGTSGESDLGLSNLQLAKYESGQDNSPMFDDVIMNANSKTMELDMVGLSSLWAMDALHLSYMARVLNDTSNYKALNVGIATMQKNVNEYLWDPSQNRYADRYWHGKSKKPSRETASAIPTAWLGNNFLARAYEDQLIKEHSARQIATNEFSGINYKKIVWAGEITVDKSNEYFFYSPVEDGVTLYIDSIKILDNRKSWITEFTSEAVTLEKGKTYRINLTYEGTGDFELKYSTTSRNRNTKVFSERFSINSFYPFIADLPDQEKKTIMLSHLTDTAQFWGDYVCPVVSKQDPAYPTQGYWRGRIWPPTNYLVFQGLQKVAPPEVTLQYAAKSVRLFMNHWEKDYLCYENWYANGEGAGFPHYTWGALNLLTGIEAVFPINNEGQLIPHQSDSLHIGITNFPVLGIKHKLSTKL